MYKIIEAGSLRELETNVRDYIKSKKLQGEVWLPEGAFTEISNGYAQTMKQVRVL